MSNVSKDIIRHGMHLDESSRNLHAEHLLKPGSQTRLATADMSWILRVEQSKSEHTSAVLPPRVPAKIGHAILSRANVNGKLVAARASGIGRQDISIRSEYKLGARKNRLVPNWPYALEITYGDPASASQIFTPNTDRAREVIGSFLALTLDDIILSSERSREAMAMDYLRMRKEIDILAARHGREAMDATSYYFNSGTYMVHIIGCDVTHPMGLNPSGRITRPVKRDTIEMNLYTLENGSIGASAASITGRDQKGNRRPPIVAYERPPALAQREFNNDEVAAAIQIFDQLCALDRVYSAAIPAPDTVYEIVDQNAQRYVEVATLPPSPVSLASLHLMS